jgi:hypothetical protein
VDGLVLLLALAFVKRDASSTGSAVVRCHIHGRSRRAREAPKRRGAPMTEDSTLTTGEHRG